ncbi:MAG TPA: hypothetical protein PLF31_02340 [Candidatus Paceibacterota bacterium]|nr:hypothetical protein [Candidatus Paceibacterota bacterium]
MKKVYLFFVVAVVSLFGSLGADTVQAYSGTGNITVVRVGFDDTVTSAPQAPGGVNAYSGINGDSLTGNGNNITSFANPNVYENLEVYQNPIDPDKRNYQAQSQDLSSYVEMFGICVYPINGSECYPSTFSVASSTTFGGSNGVGTNYYVYTTDFQLQVGYVTKVVFKYTPVSLGEVEIFRYGQNGTITSAPYIDEGNGSGYPSASVAPIERIVDHPMNMDNASQQNPVQASGIFSPTTRFAGTRNVQGYVVVAGYCTYPVNGNSCTVTDYTHTTEQGAETYYGQYTYTYAIVPVYGNTVTKVGFKYLQTSGDLRISTVDNTGNLLPEMELYPHIIGTNTNWDWPNPVEYENVVIGSTTIEFNEPYNGETLLSVKYCQANRGGSSCTPNITATYTDTGSTYEVEVPVSNDKVTLVNIAVSGTGQTATGGQILIKRVGGDDTVSTAPCTSADIDLVAPYNSLDCGQYGYGAINPTLKTGVSAGAHLAYVANKAGLVESAGSCSYPFGATECRVTVFDSVVDCTIDGSRMCRTAATVTDGLVTKVVFKYLPNVETGGIRVKLVGTDDTVYSSPEVRFFVDTQDITTNPTTLATQSVGSHVVGAKDNPISSEMAGTCTYAIGQSECSVTSFPLVPTCGLTQVSQDRFCSLPITVTQGRITKVVFKYVPSSTQVSGTNGEILIKRVGSSDTVATAPATTSFNTAWVTDGVKVSTVGLDVFHLVNVDRNPTVFTDLKEGDYSVFATDVAGYNEMVGTCTYPRGGSECSVTTFNETPVCSYVSEFDGSEPDQPYDRGCFVKASVTPGTVTKVVYKYTSGSNTTNSPTATLKVNKYVNGNLSSDGNTGYELKPIITGSDYFDRPSFTDSTRTFSGMSPGYRTILARSIIEGNDFYIKSYKVTAGYCLHVTGSPECTPTTFVDMACGNPVMYKQGNGFSGYYTTTVADPDKCSQTVEFRNGYTTRVDLKYIINNGNVKVYQVDANGTTTGVTAQKVSLNSSANQYGVTDNPAFFASTTAGQNVLYFMSSSPTAVVGTCEFTPGSPTECPVVSYNTSASCTQINNSDVRYECTAPVNVMAGMTTRVQFRAATFDYSMSVSYPAVKVTRGYETSNKVKLTSVSGTASAVSIAISGLPSGATVVGTATSCSPRCEIGLLISTLASTPVGTYQIEIVGQPLNKITTFELEVTAEQTAVLRVCNMIFNGNSPVANNNALPEGTSTMKIGTGYNIDGSLVSTFNFLTSAHVPNERFILPGNDDARCQTLNNQPYRRYTYSQAAVTAALGVKGYTDQFTVPLTSAAGLFPYSGQLFDADPNNDVLRNMEADGEVTYAPDTVQRTIVFGTESVSSGSGEIMVRRGGVNGSAANAPSGTQAKLATGAAVSSNPATFSRVGVGSQVVYATDVAGYTEEAGSCLHDEDDLNGCEPTTYTTATCSAGFCAHTATVGVNQITRTVFRYIPSTSANICSVRVSPTSPEAGQNVTWTVQPNVDGNYTYTWDGDATCGTAPGTSACRTINGSYTTGQSISKTARVYSAGSQVASCVSATVYITEPSYIEI